VSRSSACRSGPRSPQGLVSVDVADARHDRLVEDEALDARVTPHDAVRHGDGVEPASNGSRAMCVTSAGRSAPPGLSHTHRTSAGRRSAAGDRRRGPRPPACWPAAASPASRCGTVHSCPGGRRSRRHRPAATRGTCRAGEARGTSVRAVRTRSRSGRVRVAVQVVDAGPVQQGSCGR